MNIFYLDKRPDNAAEMHCDKHCVKMVLEYAQMLSTAHRELDGDVPHILYKSTHKIIHQLYGHVHQNNIMIGCFVYSEC